MKKLSDWIDRERIFQEVAMLETNARILNKVLKGELEDVSLEVVYHNSDTCYGQYFPEDDYYLSIAIDYCDDYARKLIAVDEILKEESGYGRFSGFKIKSGGFIISPFSLTRREFLEIVQSQDDKEIRQLIQEIYKISRKLKTANAEIEKSSRTLDLQRQLKIEFQNKQKINELLEGLAKIVKVKDDLVTQLYIRKEELQKKFDIDIEDLQKRMRKIC